MRLASSIQLGARAPGSEIVLRIKYDRRNASATILANDQQVGEYCDEAPYILGVLRKAAKSARDIRFLERRYGLELTEAYLARETALPSLRPGWPAREYQAAEEIRGAA